MRDACKMLAQGSAQANYVQLRGADVNGSLFKVLQGFRKQSSCLLQPFERPRGMPRKDLRLDGIIVCRHTNQQRADIVVQYPGECFSLLFAFTYQFLGKALPLGLGFFAGCDIGHDYHTFRGMERGQR